MTQCTYRYRRATVATCWFGDFSWRRRWSTAVLAESLWKRWNSTTIT